MADVDWTGTTQHPHARDLSEYLVHLTSSKAELEAILRAGMIEARTPHGLALYTAPDIGSQHTVSLTETPIPDLSRMAARGRQYGIVFAKERLRQGHRANPVWYVTDDSTPHQSLKALMNAARTAPTEPIWNLTPLIDLVRTDPASRHDFRWEREWRVVGDLRFLPAEIAALVVPKPTGGLQPLTGAVGNLLYVTPTGDFYWSGDEEELFDDALELLIDSFNSEYVPAEDAGLPWDNESEHGLAEIVPIVDTWEAAWEVFGDLPESLVEAVVDRVQHESGDLWCRQYDVDHAHE